MQRWDIARAISARELVAAGCPLDVDVDTLPGLRLEESYGTETQLFSTKPPQFGVSIWVKLFCNIPRGVLIEGAELQLPWDCLNFEWLRDPSDDGSPVDRFEYRVGPYASFPRDHVVNHRLFGRSIYRRSIEGFLLGRGTWREPEDLRHGQIVEASLIFLDSLGYAHPYKVPLWACFPDTSGAVPTRARRGQGSSKARQAA